MIKLKGILSEVDDREYDKYSYHGDTLVAGITPAHNVDPNYGYGNDFFALVMIDNTNSVEKVLYVGNDSAFKKIVGKFAMDGTKKANVGSLLRTASKSGYASVSIPKAVYQKLKKNSGKLLKTSVQVNGLKGISEGKLTEGFITKYNNKSDMSILSKYVRSFMDWCWETKDDALDVAGMYLDQDEPKLAKNWRTFSQALIIIYKELKNFDEKYAARTKAVLPTPLQKKLENAKFHQGPTTEDNYKQVLKQANMFMKELKKLK